MTKASTSQLIAAGKCRSVALLLLLTACNTPAFGQSGTGLAKTKVAKIGTSYVLVPQPRHAFPSFAPVQTGGSFSLRFHGNGVNDIDRVKIPIDEPERPVDVGTVGFTLEFWMKAGPQTSTTSCSVNNDSWILGNIVFDRDVVGSGDFGDYGISIMNGRVAFGVNNGATGVTACGSTNVVDNQWHHIAVTRSTSNGELIIYVDGSNVGSVAGPTGDLSYRNGRPTSFPNSDPFLVIGAEKMDAGSGFPSYSGFVDEVRISKVIRYSGNFTRPTQEFTTDAGTVGLYHFNEGSNTTVNDSSGALGGPSNGLIKFGGSPAGPEWSTDTPFQSAGFTIGLFRPSGNLFFLRNTNTSGAPDITVAFGAPGDVPVVGDWDGNGTVTIGLYRTSTSTFYLRNSNSFGVPDITVSYGDGPGGDVPIVGDWDGDGTWTIGVYRPGTATFLLRNSNAFGSPDINVPFGGPGDQPLAGDWDGNGTMTIGLFRPSGNLFFLRNSNTLGSPDLVVPFGAPGDQPIVGDWDGNVTTTIGLFRPTGNLFFLRNSNATGVPDVTVSYGAPGDQPIVGNWDGN